MKTPPAMQLQKEMILSVERLKLQSFDDFLATMQTGIMAHIAITMYTMKAVTASKTWLSMMFDCHCAAVSLLAQTSSLF